MAALQLSKLAGTLIGSEIVKLGGEIRDKISKGEKIYNFTIGDFDPQIFPIPKELEEEIIAAYRNHFTNYPAAEGNLDLRNAICEFTREREQIDYNIDEVLVASGGRPLIYALFRAICDKGDKVIYAVPSWNNNHYVHLVEGEHVVIDTTPETDFMPDAESIRPYIEGATLLALCSPQNPTGTTFSRAELEKICDMVIAENRRRSTDAKKLYVMFDQMYWHLTYGKIQHYNPVTLSPEMREYTVFIDAISKVFAATGVRVGWSLGPSAIIGKMKAILTHVGAWAPMAEQKAVAKFLLQKGAIDKFLHDFRREIEEKLQRIYEGFMQLKQEGLPVNAIAPQAAIYLTVEINLVNKTRRDGNMIKSQQEVTSYLLEVAKLAVVPFYAFGAAHDSTWYRLSVGTCKTEEIADMISQLRQALKGLN